MKGFVPGVLMAVLGGTLTGSFTAPMKFTKNWAWENTWLVYAIIGLACIPVVVALLSVPDLMAVYRSASPTVLTLTMLFGFGWGIGSVLLGAGVNRLGLALGFAIIIGLTAALGSLIPLVVLFPGALFTARGAGVLTGLAIVICGIILCAKAGAMRNATDTTALSRDRYQVGLVICIAAGVFSSMLNLALAFGSPVAVAATQRGATPAAAQNAIWAVAAGAGSLANIGYALFLLFRNQSWSRFGAACSSTNLLLGASMGALWMAGVVVYGAGAAVLGKWGAVLGWPLFMSMVIVTGNVWGLLTGEWKTAPQGAQRVSLAGVAVLITAIVVIAVGGTL
jgi:L-rhamnose-H+ transport protein